MGCVLQRGPPLQAALGERGEDGGRGLQGVFLVAPACLLLPSSLLLRGAQRSSFPIFLSLKSKRNRKLSTVQDPGHFPRHTLC